MTFRAIPPSATKGVSSPAKAGDPVTTWLRLGHSPSRGGYSMPRFRARASTHFWRGIFTLRGWARSPGNERRSWDQVMRFWRFLGNERVTVAKLIEGWSAQTREAVRGHHVLANQDSSDIKFS